ncbi:MAG TPA: 4a-hydroxytetrahydrobiopterin dehydratase [Candidatus Acidoferrum sp.]|nr:4a-hydroxytetrahydrobiopterin dehydratase [Candidatus Acidoferrum sp.]
MKTTIAEPNAELVEHHTQVPEWQVIEVDNFKMLGRVFKFENFSEALRFTNKVGSPRRLIDRFFRKLIRP